MHTKKVRSMKIQTRLMISFIAFIIVVTLIGDAVLYYQDMKLLMSDLKNDVCDLAASASLLVDGDMIKRVESSGDMSSEEYIRIWDDLCEFQEVTGVACIYTLAGNGADQTRFIVDADPEEPVAIGEEYDYFDGMAGAFDGSVSANNSVYTDEWGTYLSGYAPIKDSEGNVAAILAVDISAETIHAKQMLFLKNFAIKAFFTMLLVIIITFLICRKITRPIYLLENSLKELSTSGGDLTKTIEIHTGDEIEALGSSINAFIANIRQIICKAAEVSEQVITGSSSLENAIIQSTHVLEQNTIAIQTIASGTVDQVNDIDAVTNRVMSMSRELEDSDRQIDLINETITLSEEHINTGTHIVQELNAKTDTNLMAFSDVDRKIGHLVTDVNGISEILHRISYVSYQINLLALNAGIEAARAGEAGNGFSVVATEIKKLAAQTAQSVSEVDQIITRIFDDTDQVKSQISIVNTTISQQKRSVEDTEMAFSGIHENVSALIEGVSFINSTFKNVNASISGISASMQMICGVSQENAALTEELSASSEEQSASMCEIETTVTNLRGLCEELEATIEKFIL